MTCALARRHGGVFREPRRPSVAPRTLEEIAIENVVEGCVRETFGALVASYQAEMATDNVIKAAMMRIAQDETRHAALAWKLAGWFNGRLDPVARQRVEQARRRAAEQLARDHQGLEAPEFAQALGLPSPIRGAWLVGELAKTLWS